MGKLIQENIKSLELKHEYSDVSNQITLSMGITTTIPTQNHSSSDLIALADKALYLAKENGRNSIIAKELN